jgi:Tat protein translocase TatB subunit
MEVFGIGLPELLVILVLALIVFGPERLPKIARDLGSTLASFRREAEGIRQEFLASMETVQSPMQDTIQELRSALNVSFAPPRPAPMELPDASLVSDELPPFARDEPNSDAAPSGQSVTTTATPPASAKAAPPATATPAASLAAANGPIQRGVEKHRQPDLAKPLPLPVPAAPATPSAPTIPSIEPSSTPAVNRAALDPSLDETAPLDEPEADALFGHNPFFEETMIVSVGEAAYIPDAVAEDTEAAPDAEAAHR